VADIITPRGGKALQKIIGALRRWSLGQKQMPAGGALPWSVAELLQPGAPFRVVAMARGLGQEWQQVGTVGSQNVVFRPALGRVDFGAPDG
jgi:hypothetical protein